MVLVEVRQHRVDLLLPLLCYILLQEAFLGDSWLADGVLSTFKSLSVGIDSWLAPQRLIIVVQ